MRRIGSWCRQNYFSVTRQFNFAGTRRAICNANATYFGVVFWRNNDLRLCQDACIEAVEDRAVFHKRHLITLRRASRRLKAGRPDGAAPDIAHVAKASPVVAREIFTPASHSMSSAHRIAGS